MIKIESIEVNPSNSSTITMENGDKYIISYSGDFSILSRAENKKDLIKIIKENGGSIEKIKDKK